MTLELALIWVAWVVAGGSPGPATMGIAATSMQLGRKSGLIFALGILFGSASWGIAAALGMGAIMLANAWLFSVIKYIGAAYLFYLAVKALRAAFLNNDMMLKPQTAAGQTALFWKAALIHITNPKAILSWGSIFAIALPADASLYSLLLVFLFLYAGSILIFIGYAFLFSSSAAVRGYRRAKRWFELTFGILFGAASLRLLTYRPE